MRLTVLLMLVVACGSSEDEKAAKQRECDQIATDIRDAARARSLPEEGACNNPNATDFATACARLKQCNNELASM